MSKSINVTKSAATVSELSLAYVRSIQPSLLIGLNELGKEHGLRFTMDGGKVGKYAMTMRLTATLAGKEAAAADTASARFAGFDPKWVGRVVTNPKGVEYTIKGFDRSKPKFAVKCETSEGKAANITVDFARKLIEALDAAPKSSKRAAKAAAPEAANTKRNRRAAKVDDLVADLLGSDDAQADADEIDADAAPAKRSRRSKKVAATKEATGRKPMSAKAKRAFAEKMKAARAAKADEKPARASKRRGAKVVAKADAAPKLTRAEKAAKAARAEKRAARKEAKLAAERKAARGKVRAAAPKRGAKVAAKPARGARSTKRTAKAAKPAAKSTGRRSRMA